MVKKLLQMNLFGLAIIQVWVVTATDVFFVLPDASSNMSCLSQPCGTLSQYLLDNNGTLPVVSNVEYHLLPGEHHVPPNMILTGLYNFTLIGIASKALSPAIIISCVHSLLYINYSQYVAIRNLIFQQCNLPITYRQNYKSHRETNLLLNYCWSCRINEVVFLKYGMIGINMIGDSHLNNISINLTVSNSASYLRYQGISLEYTNLSLSNHKRFNIKIREASITGHGNKCLDTINDQNYYAGLAILLQQLNYDLSIVVSDSHFHDMDQAVLYIENQCSVTEIKVIFSNCIFEFNVYTNVCSYVSMVVAALSQFNTTLVFSNCTFTNNAQWSYLIGLIPFDNDSSICLSPVTTTICTYPNEVYFIVCSFHKTGNPIFRINGGELSRYTPKVYFVGHIEVTETNYTENSVAYISNMIVHIEGPVVITNNDVDYVMHFEMCQVTFYNEIIIKTNRCIRIFTISLEPGYLKVMQHSSIIIINNNVSNEIIAYDHNGYNVPYPYCIFQFILNETNDTVSLKDYNIVDIGNYNYNEEITLKCSVPFSHFMYHCKWMSTSAFYGYKHELVNPVVIHSETSRQEFDKHTTICSCPRQLEINCTTDVLGAVYPGQTLQIDFCIPCSDGGATLYIETHNTLLPSSACKIAHQSELVIFLDSSSKSVSLTIVSEALKTCELFLTVSPYLHQVYETFYVELLPCPLGFILQNGICDCDPVLLNNRHVHIDTCNIDKSTIRRPENVWIIPEHINNSQYLLCADCPMDYCLPHSSNLNLQSPDLQCQFNRTGILCSQCQHSLSMVFGSSRCIHCTNVHILITTIILTVGILLVLTLYLFNLTVTTGTINGMMFYANVVSINGSVFLANHNVFKPLQIFISFLNLDLGIEMCFYNGMDGYIKILLQLFFPFYLIIVAIFIILVSHYSTRILRWTYARSLPVLATLFLLSYTSILRVVLTVLFSYSTITHLPNGDQQLVWSIDASVPLFELKFAILFITCLVLFILLVPFTIILLFSRFLSQFRIINRFKPLLDAFQGSYKDKYHYWIGLTMIIRSTLFSLYAFQVKMRLILSTTLLMCFALSSGYFHPNKNKLVNFQDTLTLLNITIMHAMSYQSDSRLFSIVSNIMIACTFAHFCLILFYHIGTYTCHCDLIGLVTIGKQKMMRAKQVENSSSTIELNIPERLYNYSQYQDGLVSDDFK